MNKTIQSIHKAHPPHMVGDGLPVRNFFSYQDLGREVLSPFLLLDYGSPSHFPPTTKTLGVGMHPHRGFETVTFVFQGGLAHRDTAGNHGVIGPGDVQWMTAGSGVLHEELHSPEFQEQGGTLQMLQLWVNLPAKDKMTEPKYQTIRDEQIPVVSMAGGKANIKVVAGEFKGRRGPANTFTPVDLFDAHLQSDTRLTISVPEGRTAALVLLSGKIEVNNEQTIDSESLLILSRAGADFEIAAKVESHVVILSGEPINEPVVGYGPFVMNTREQITEAYNDFQNGKFGSKASTSS